jgi:hypothetical protein
MKKCIYTVITANYDPLREPSCVTPGWDYICFTDNPSIQSNTWKIVLITPEPGGETPHELSRRYKLLPHKYLPEYDITLYIDASFGVKGDLDALTLPIVADLTFMLRHIDRSVIDELDDLVRYKTYTREQTNRIQQLIVSEGYTPSKGTYYNGGLILRKKSTFSDEFMGEWYALTKRFHRDQIPLHILLDRIKYKPNEYSWNMVKHYLTFNLHPREVPQSDDPDVYYFTPGDPHKRIGKVYNSHCESVPNNHDWICVRDGDTMFLTSNWSQVIQDVIKRYPDTALFGCYTNRVGLKYQLTEEEGFSDNPDIAHHAAIARARWEKYGTECVEIDKPVAGMFMLFPRWIWTKAPFKDKLVLKNKFFDWDFGERIIQLGGKVRLIKGLYLMHYYRMHTGREDKSHLL